MSWMVLPNMRWYDFDYQPPHPQDWIPVLSRYLDEGENFQLGDWLRAYCQGGWDTITHYTPALRQLVYFQTVQDAVLFKLTWGGES